MTRDPDDLDLDSPGPLSLAETDEFEWDVARETVRAALFLEAPRARMLGRYRLLRRLGSGGMGVVFLAHDPRLDRQVAVKLLREGLEEGSASEGLLHEARSIARLAHPNVVAVHDADIERGRLFVAMEYVDGGSLESWAAAPRPWHEAAAMMVQAGRGLAAAHAVGIVHRDFKPANVLIGRDGRPRVADFGLATADEPGRAARSAGGRIVGVVSDATVIAGANVTSRQDGGERAGASAGASPIAGTPLYMAPEQLLSGVFDARSDQYAFCVSLFELVYGRRPVEASSLAELCSALLERGPVFPAEGPAVPAALREVLARGLSRLPQDRYPDMDALLEALARIVDAEAPREPPELLADPIRSGDSRCERYLARLEHGVDGHPSCTVRAALIRLALARHPLGAGVPPAVGEALGHPSLRGERVAATRGELIMLAIFDAHFGEDGVDRWRELLRGLVRSQLSGNLQLSAVSRVALGSAPAIAARTWNTWHQGTSMAVEPLAPGRASVALRWPRGLHDPLVAVDVEEFLRVALEMMGGKWFELRWTAQDDGRLDGALVWR